MQWVPPPVTARLERNVRARRNLGCAAWRADVIGARILTHYLPKAEELAVQLEEYRHQHAKVLRPRGRRAALMLRIPSAVSLRLDAMVAGVRAIGFAAYRHEVVGTDARARTRRQRLARRELQHLPGSSGRRSPRTGGIPCRSSRVRATRTRPPFALSRWPGSSRPRVCVTSKSVGPDIRERRLGGRLLPPVR